METVMKRFTFIVIAGFMLTTSAFSADLGFKAAGAKVGMIIPASPWDVGFMVGGTSDMGELMDNLSLFPSLSYWNSGYSYGSYKLNLSNFQIAGDVHYYFKEVKGLYAGGGLSLNFITMQFPSFSYYGATSNSYSETSTNVGIAFLGGYEMDISGFRAFAEAKYNLISDLSTLELVIGMYF
jgi:hypothetical protein